MFAVASYLCTNNLAFRKSYVEFPDNDAISVSSFGGGDDYAFEEGEIFTTQLLSFPFLFTQHLIEAVKQPYAQV